jgi:hypothetical protein
MYQGEIWWANLPDPVGSEPGYRRPVLVVQDDTFPQSRIIQLSLSLSLQIFSWQKPQAMYCYRKEQQACLGIQSLMYLKFSQSIKHSWLNVLVPCQTTCRRR